MYLYGVLQKYIIEIHIINKVPFQKKKISIIIIISLIYFKSTPKMILFFEEKKFESISQQLKVTPKMAIKYSL